MGKLTPFSASAPPELSKFVTDKLWAREPAARADFAQICVTLHALQNKYRCPEPKQVSPEMVLCRTRWRGL